MNGKAIELRERGLGKHNNKADPLTEDEEALWESGALGGENPSRLNHTIWYLLSQQFGTRGNQEHTEIMMEDLKWVRVPQTNHIRYVEWTGLTKTRHGGLREESRSESSPMKQIVVLSDFSRSLSQNGHLHFV